MAFQRGHELLLSGQECASVWHCRSMCVRMRERVCVCERERHLKWTDRTKTFSFWHKIRASTPWTSWSYVSCLKHLWCQSRDQQIQRRPHPPWCWLLPHLHIYPTLEGKTWHFTFWPVHFIGQVEDKLFYKNIKKPLVFESIPFWYYHTRTEIFCK